MKVGQELRADGFAYIIKMVYIAKNYRKTYDPKQNSEKWNIYMNHFI